VRSRHGCPVCEDDRAFGSRVRLEPVPWGTGSAKLLTARFCALRVQPRARRSVVALRTIAHRRARYYLLHLPARATVVRRVTSGRC
jgi:hypothetical protein